MPPTPAAAEIDPTTLLAEAELLLASDRPRDAVDLLLAAYRRTPTPAIEARLVDARNASARSRLAGRTKATPAAPDERAPAAPASAPPAGTSPIIAPADLSAEGARTAIETHGHVVVPGLFTPDLVAWFVDGIDRAIDARADTTEARDPRWYRTLPLPKGEAGWLGRHWVGASGGVLGIDAPALLCRLLDEYERLGLKDLISGILDEAPLLGGNKCTMRKVDVAANTEWHQDGAFLGQGIRAVNVWIALTDCGQDAPGIDLVPTRIDDVIETGTGGAIFDWSVGPDTVTTVARDVGVTRPTFRAGDALLFDEVFLHRTGIDASMDRPRYAIESWFFGPSHYPERQVAIDW